MAHLSGADSSDELSKITNVTVASTSVDGASEHNLYILDKDYDEIAAAAQDGLVYLVITEANNTTFGNESIPPGKYLLTGLSPEGESEFAIFSYFIWANMRNDQMQCDAFVAASKM